MLKPVIGKIAIKIKEKIKTFIFTEKTWMRGDEKHPREDSPINCSKDH